MCLPSDIINRLGLNLGDETYDNQGRKQKIPEQQQAQSRESKFDEEFHIRMRIKILGTRGEVEPSSAYHARHSGALIDKKLLLDLGEKEFLKERFEAVLLTHLHPDHAFFAYGQGEEFKPDFPVFAPEEYNKGNFQVLSKPRRLKGYKITPIPTIHSKRVKSQGYVVQKGRVKIFYSGDLIWIKKQHHKELKNLNLVITEASFLRESGMVRRDKESGRIYGHNGVPDLIRLFSRFTDRIVFMHFGSWFYEIGASRARQKIQKLGIEKGVNARAAYDGLTLTI